MPRLPEAQRLTLKERYGFDAAEYFIRIAIDEDQPTERRDYAAAQVLPYQHPKLKQVELLDPISRKRPEEIERDITEFVERLKKTVGEPPPAIGAARDLVGDAGPALAHAQNESDR